MLSPVRRLLRINKLYRAADEEEQAAAGDPAKPDEPEQALETSRATEATEDLFFGNKSPEQEADHQERMAILEKEDERRAIARESVNMMIDTMKADTADMTPQEKLEYGRRAVASNKGDPGKPDEGAGGNGPKELKGGLYNDEIDKMMSKHPNYLGTITRDEIYELLPMIKQYWKGRKPFGFIMNTLPQDSKRKVGHWIAICIVPRKSINYFDSFGEPATKDLKKDLKIILDTINKKDDLVKFKENTIKHQSVNTANCGWYSMRFLQDMFKGKPFVESTPYSKVMQSEKAIKQYKKYFKKFKYF